MQNGRQAISASNLKFAFESGYANAAASLSKMINENFLFTNLQAGFRRLDSGCFKSHSFFSRKGVYLLLTTEIFGELTGKSYLLISDDEFDLLTRGIRENKNPSVNLKEEFVKELDNILSASVITHLSNKLSKKVYGDIPVLAGRSDNRIENIIFDDFNEQTKEVYINAACFTIDNNPSICPLFIWALYSSTFKRTEPLSVNA